VAKSADQRAWIEAYEVEQLLVHLFDEKTLATELGLRSLEAQAVLRPAVASWYVEQDAKTDKAAIADRRALLARLVNDLQWRYTINEAKRGYSNEITRRSGWVFILAIALFFLVLTTADPQRLIPDRNDPELLGIVASAGFWGATFSMIIGLKERLDASDLDALKVMRSTWLLLARALIGVGAALILYFFLQSGVLAGSAFPEVIHGGVVLSGKNLALLIAWSFIAGFSEKLVPNLLAKTEGRAETRLPLTGPQPASPPPPPGAPGPHAAETPAAPAPASPAAAPAAGTGASAGATGATTAAGGTPGE
jgi:hypothetical protein